jgi:hypothetical protein
MAQHNYLYLLNKLLSFVAMNKWLPFLFSFIAFSAHAQIDTTIGVDVPSGAAKDYVYLAHHLCDDQSDERTKVNAIYNWITHNIKYDAKAMYRIGDRPKDLADKTFRKRKGTCDGYSTLFVEMCREAGLPAATVDGYAKDWTYDNGDKLYIPRHAWAGVMVDGKWQLADPTWGAGGLIHKPRMVKRVINKLLRRTITYTKRVEFRFHYDTSYFMPDPEEFRLTHLPSDPLWQLTDTAMPISYFETGDSAVKSFNNLYSKHKQNNPTLLPLSKLETRQKTFEQAGREYDYNNRFVLVLAQKSILQAVSQVESAMSDTVTNPGLLVRAAESELQKSQEYVKQQKKAFPDAYNALKKKNKTKSMEAKQYLRETKTDNKRGIAQFKKYARGTVAKNKRLANKVGEVKKGRQALKPRNIADVETAKVQKKAGSPQLVAITDSVNARKARLILAEKTLLEKKQKTEAVEKANRERLDSLSEYITLSDSAMIKEAIGRLNLHDNFDEDIKGQIAQYKNAKYRHVDSLQKYYLANFDSVCAHYEEQFKIHKGKIDLYKKNLKSIQQFKKANSSDGTLTGTYSEWVNDYQNQLDAYYTGIIAYQVYLKESKKLFERMSKHSMGQVKLADYMDKVEKARKYSEDKTITRKKAYDLKENEWQRNRIKKLQQKLRNIEV